MEVGQGPNWGCSAKEKNVLMGELALNRLNSLSSCSKRLTKKQVSALNSNLNFRGLRNEYGRLVDVNCVALTRV
jgi:hypothetical protein